MKLIPGDIKKSNPNEAPALNRGFFVTLIAP